MCTRAHPWPLSRAGLIRPAASLYFDIEDRAKGDLMPKKVLRTVQPAHHSDRITVEQAKEAWLAVEREAREGRSRRAKRSAASPRLPADTSGASENGDD